MFSPGAKRHPPEADVKPPVAAREEPPGSAQLPLPPPVKEARLEKPPAPPASVVRTVVQGARKPPNERFLLRTAWFFLFLAVLTSAVVLANGVGDDKKKPKAPAVAMVSAQAVPVVVDPKWVGDGVFHWGDREWTCVLGGCPKDCEFSAVAVKSTCCWRMVTQDGSLYLGQRTHPAAQQFDRRGRFVHFIDEPLVNWAVLDGTWKDGMFVDSKARKWRVHFEADCEHLAMHPLRLEVVEVQTAAGLRLITRAGSFLLGPVPPAPPLPKDAKDVKDPPK